MKIAQLLHFAGIAKYGSFSKAAIMLHISQPALTRSISVLEDQLQTQLFERSSHGAQLTDTGKVLYRHALPIINSLDAARDDVMAAREGMYGVIHAGCASLFTNMILGEAIRTVVEGNPKVRVSVQVGLYEEMAQRVLDGRLDFLLMTNPDVEFREYLSFEPLCDVTSVIVARPDHYLAHKSAVTLADLSETAWVTLEQPHMDAFMRMFFAAADLHAPRSRVQTNSLEMLRSMLRQGGFVGFLPSHWVEADVVAGTLEVLNVEGTPIRRQAGLVYRRDYAQSGAAGLLMSELRRMCNAPPDN